MSLESGYAVLKGHVIAGIRAKSKKDHYLVRVVDEELDYRISINVSSKAKDFKTDLWFLLIEDFQHPILKELEKLPLGRKVFAVDASAEERRQSDICLDFIRMNLFDRSKMKLIPTVLDGEDNDLNDRIDDLIESVSGDGESLIYAFGEPWINENKKDKYFGFFPGNGVHNIHMNQGDLTGDYAKEDGLYQDGALIFYVASKNQYIAYFTKFDSQAWHTDDVHGHAVDGQNTPLPHDPERDPVPVPSGGGGNPIEPGSDPDFTVRIIAAMVNPVGPAPEAETVTLLNTTAQAIELTGWKIADKQKNKQELSGTLPAGGTLQIRVQDPVKLSNSGGIITLLNVQGIKVHGVSYTGQQARREGETITFA